MSSSFFPTCSVALTDDVRMDKDKAKHVQARLEHTTLRKIMSAVEIFYDPDPLNTVIPEDRKFFFALAGGTILLRV